MSMIEYTAATKDTVLSEFASGLFPELNRNTVAEFIAPSVPVDVTDGRFVRFDKGIPFTVENAELTEEENLPRVKFNGEKVKYSITPHGLQAPISNFSRRQAGDMADLMEQATIKSLLGQMVVTREYAVGKAIAKSTARAGTNYGKWLGTAGAGTDIIGELDELIIRLNEAAGGMLMPNRMVLPPRIWQVIKNHPSVRERVAGLNTAASLEVFKSMLIAPDLDIRLASLCYNEAKGKAASLKPIFSDSLLLFHGVENPTTEDYSFAKCFDLTGDDYNANATVHTVPTPLGTGNIHYCLWAQDIVIAAPDAGIIVDVT